jgi:hypothetical protein
MTGDTPECGFVEQPDGTIVWGSAWEPGSYSGPEPICIEYRLESCGAWIPFTTWTLDAPVGICSVCHLVSYRDGQAASPRCRWCGKDAVVASRSLDHHDCDWIEREQTLYHHCSGGGGRAPNVGGFSEPEALPGRIWIADGVTVRNDEKLLTDDDLLAMGYRRVHGPTPDPFADGIEGETFYDDRTGDRHPDDDGERCSCCDEDFIRQKDDLVVRDENDVDEDEIVGLYRRGSWVFDPGVWVCPLPHNLHADWGDASVCPKCAVRTVSDFTLRGLLDAWCEDAEAMPDEHREALLDAVRERVDRWIAGYPERRATEVHGGFGKELHKRLGVQPREMLVLFEEAGYPA